jgi:hypothetical protein
MFTSAFWTMTLERAIKTFAQSLAALLGAKGLGLVDANWLPALSAAGMVALLSVLTSLASLQIGPVNTPSVVREAPAPATEPARPAAASVPVSA